MAFQYFRELTFDSTKAGTFYLRLENFDYSHCDPDGKDIRFFDDYGEPIEYKIEKWDATGVSEFILLRKRENSRAFLKYGNQEIDTLATNPSLSALNSTWIDDFEGSEFGTAWNNDGKWSLIGGAAHVGYVKNATLRFEDPLDLTIGGSALFRFVIYWKPTGDQNGNYFLVATFGPSWNRGVRNSNVHNDRAQNGTGDYDWGDYWYQSGVTNTSIVDLQNQYCTYYVNGSKRDPFGIVGGTENIWPQFLMYNAIVDIDRTEIIKSDCDGNISLGKEENLFQVGGTGFQLTFSTFSPLSQATFQTVIHESGSSENITLATSGTEYVLSGSFVTGVIELPSKLNNLRIEAWQGSSSKIGTLIDGTKKIYLKSSDEPPSLNYEGSAWKSGDFPSEMADYWGKEFLGTFTEHFDGSVFNENWSTTSPSDWSIGDGFARTPAFGGTGYLYMTSHLKYKPGNEFQYFASMYFDNYGIQVLQPFRGHAIGQIRIHYWNNDIEYYYGNGAYDYISGTKWADLDTYFVKVKFKNSTATAYWKWANDSKEATFIWGLQNSSASFCMGFGGYANRAASVFEFEIKGDPYNVWELVSPVQIPEERKKKYVQLKIPFYAG